MDSTDNALWRVNGAEQSQSYAWSSVVTTWMDDCYMRGFVPTLRFFQSQTVQTLQKSFR